MGKGKILALSDLADERPGSSPATSFSLADLHTALFPVGLKSIAAGRSSVN